MSMSNTTSFMMADQQHSSSSTVLRRGQPFFMAVRMKDRNFDPRRDILRVTFNFGTVYLYMKESGRAFVQSNFFYYLGPNPQVTKGTRVVLPYRPTQREFSRAPRKWDIRLHQQDGFNISFQVRFLKIDNEI